MQCCSTQLFGEEQTLAIIYLQTASISTDQGQQALVYMRLTVARCFSRGQVLNGVQSRGGCVSTLQHWIVKDLSERCRPDRK